MTIAGYCKEVVVDRQGPFTDDNGNRKELGRAMDDRCCWKGVSSVLLKTII